VADGAGTLDAAAAAKLKGGSAMGACKPSPLWWSTHVGQSPLAQSPCPGSAWAAPRCSVQPGQLHWKPQQHPLATTDSTYADVGTGADEENASRGTLGSGAGVTVAWLPKRESGGSVGVAADDAFLAEQQEDLGISSSNSETCLLRLGSAGRMVGETLPSRARFFAFVAAAFVIFGFGR
jgi:hypothetical protein